MIYRIMYDTASMTVGTDFIEMAQLLGDAALPAEAQTVKILPLPGRHSRN